MTLPSDFPRSIQLLTGNGYVHRLEMYVEDEIVDIVEIDDIEEEWIKKAILDFMLRGVSTFEDHYRWRNT